MYSQSELLKSNALNGLAQSIASWVTLTGYTWSHRNLLALVTLSAAEGDDTALKNGGFMIPMH